jgi:hypothetical protein
LPHEFTIAGWHAVHDAAKDTLLNMQTTHKVIPLPAYDMHGNLIRPEDYRKHLQGAIVQVHFTMTHWHIRAHGDKSACDSYTADVYSMRVLVPPAPVGPVTPRRKRVLRKDPMTPELSPVKKLRLN